MTASFNDFIGISTEQRKLHYSCSKLALYALSVGAQPDELLYTFEKGIKALPSFGAVPYWAASDVEPYIELPKPAPVYAEKVLKNKIAPLHMDHRIVIHNAIDPLGSFLTYKDSITDIYDRGPGKGLVIKSVMDVYDNKGTPICTNTAHVIYTEFGGFSGKPFPKPVNKIPEKEPDIIVRDYISPTQNLLYRLASGDTNLVHVSPQYAKTHGFEKPFMQGMCSFGFACRMAIGKLIPGEPERLREMYARMRSIAYPDTHIKLQLWTVARGEALFRLTDETGNIILDKGEFRWE